jgi:hypothetical protein
VFGRDMLRRSREADGNFSLEVMSLDSTNEPLKRAILKTQPKRFLFSMEDAFRLFFDGDQKALSGVEPHTEDPAQCAGVPCNSGYVVYWY